MQVPPQEMLSRDSVTVSVDAVCFYKVSALTLLVLLIIINIIKETLKENFMIFPLYEVKSCKVQFLSNIKLGNFTRQVVVRRPEQLGSNL